MDPDVFRSSIAAAVAEIDKIDAEVALLQSRKRTLSEYLRAAEALVTQADQLVAALPGRPGGGGPSSPPRPLARARAGELDARTATRIRSARRRYMQGLVDTTLEIIEREGRPLTMDEIYAQHPESGNVDRALLYHTVHKRVKEAKRIGSDRGYFWPLDRPTPTDWTHPLDVETSSG